jgi:hypothetical protein
MTSGGQARVVSLLSDFYAEVNATPLEHCCSHPLDLQDITSAYTFRCVGGGGMLDGCGPGLPEPCAESCRQLLRGTAPWLDHIFQCGVQVGSVTMRAVVRAEPTGWREQGFAVSTGGVFGWAELRTKAALPAGCHSRGYIERMMSGDPDGWRWETVPWLPAAAARERRLPVVAPAYPVPLPTAHRLAFLSGRLPESGAAPALAKLSTELIQLIFARCGYSSALHRPSEQGELQFCAAPRLLGPEWLYVRDVELDDPHRRLGRLCYCLHKTEPLGAALLVVAAGSGEEAEPAAVVVVAHRRKRSPQEEVSGRGTMREDGQRSSNRHATLAAAVYLGSRLLATSVR